MFFKNLWVNDAQKKKTKRNISYQLLHNELPPNLESNSKYYLTVSTCQEPESSLKIGSGSVLRLQPICWPRLQSSEGLAESWQFHF